MESRMQDQIEGAQSQNERLLVRADRLEKALTAIRKAAGGSRHFTNRLQFIYERAGVALADEEWDEEWKATHGYTMRTNILSENERLKAQVAQLQQRIAELEAARIAYASEFPLNADGEPDVGNIHANIRKLKAEKDAVLRVEQLQNMFADMYQAAGELGASKELLDVLGAAMCGEPLPDDVDWIALLESLTSSAEGDAEFYQGVIAALGALSPHCKHGDTIHDEIVRSVGKEKLYAAADPEDIEWAGLDPEFYAATLTKEGNHERN